MTRVSCAATGSVRRAEAIRAASPRARSRLSILSLLVSRRCGRLGGRLAAAEIGLDDGRVALDLGGRAFGDHLAAVEHDDAVAQPHDQLEVVVDDEQAEPVAPAQ